VGFQNLVVTEIKVTKIGVMNELLIQILFLIYSNDLSNAILHNATPILFADDTSILITGQNVH
jgi:hypothetical protein